MWVLGNPDLLFDHLSQISESNRRKLIFWPTQTMLLILCPDILFSIGLGTTSSNSGSSGSLSELSKSTKSMINSKKSVFLESLRKSLRSKLSEVATFCYVDICRASTYVSKTDGSALRLIVPNIETELKVKGYLNLI